MCRRCPYLVNGSVAICFTCASRTLAPLPEHGCPVCGQRLKADGTCVNAVCGWSNRQFSQIWAISMLTGPLHDAIHEYKYPPAVRAWAFVFGRVVAGFLDANASTFQRFDLIVPSPSYIDPEAEEAWGHTETVLAAAALEAGERWPFEEDVIIKTAPTMSMVEAGSWPARGKVAWGPLRKALQVPDRQRVAGKRILVYDDVFTEGLTIMEVARCLRRAGAIEVSEVVLARTPWTP